MEIHGLTTTCCFGLELGPNNFYFFHFHAKPGCILYSQSTPIDSQGRPVRPQEHPVGQAHPVGPEGHMFDLLLLAGQAFRFAVVHVRYFFMPSTVKVSLFMTMTNWMMQSS